MQYPRPFNLVAALLTIFTFYFTILACQHGDRITPLLNPAEIIPSTDIPPTNWQNKDAEDDGYVGISLEKACKSLLNGRSGRPVIVAVIDSGVDSSREELLGIWLKEKGRIVGRNFIGSEYGKEDFISYLRLKETQVNAGIAREDLQLHRLRLTEFLESLNKNKAVLNGIRKKIGRDSVSFTDIERFITTDSSERQLVEIIKRRKCSYSNFQVMERTELDDLISAGAHHLNNALDSLSTESAKTIAENNESDFSNGRVGLTSPSSGISEHGTIVAGIIAAPIDSGCLWKAANYIKIIPLKAYDNIREMRNNALALAIRFSVDHGARIINMSFGKRFSFDRQQVDDAVKYAMQKDVLIIHSAGNDGLNLDSNNFFPSPHFADGGKAENWLTIGASSYNNDSHLVPDFSNFGKQEVDLFAPGVEITSTSLYKQWATVSGTSEAAPIVSRVAAILMSYFPDLHAKDIKRILMESVQKNPMLTNRCFSGGILNAYNALRLAEQEEKGRSHSRN